MRMNAIYNVVFNRKKVDLQSGDKALVQIEILTVHDKKKYIGTGIYLESNQWDAAHEMVINHPLSGKLTNNIKSFINGLQSFELAITNEGRMMTVDDINGYLNKTVNKDQSFSEYMKTEIEKRNDIVTVVKGKHLMIQKEITKFGLKNFSDLTHSNIQKYDYWLREQGKEQTTIHKRHAVIKRYIHQAERDGKIPYGSTGYQSFQVTHGKSKIRQRLDDSEIDKLMSKVFDDKELSFSRDLYVFTIFTGIAYKDVRELTWSKSVRVNDNMHWIEGLRKKNGEFFGVPLVKEAYEIMLRYKDGDKVFKAPDVWKQNRTMAIVEKLTGITKRMSTHTARHTAATYMLRSGIAIDVVRDILGHTSVKTTEIYGKLERKTIQDQIQRITKKAPDKSEAPQTN